MAFCSIALANAQPVTLAAFVARHGGTARQANGQDTHAHQGDEPADYPHHATHCSPARSGPDTGID